MPALRPGCLLLILVVLLLLFILGTGSHPGRACFGLTHTSLLLPSLNDGLLGTGSYWEPLGARHTWFRRSPSLSPSLSPPVGLGPAQLITHVLRVGGIRELQLPNFPTIWGKPGWVWVPQSTLCTPAIATSPPEYISGICALSQGGAGAEQPRRSRFDAKNGNRSRGEAVTQISQPALAPRRLRLRWAREGTGTAPQPNPHGSTAVDPRGGGTGARPPRHRHLHPGISGTAASSSRRLR